MIFIFCTTDYKLIIIKYDTFLFIPNHVNSGVPQGDYISSLLFVLFIIDINSVIKHSYIFLLADDTKIYITINSINDDLKLQSDLDNFCSWCLQNGMESNISKCSVITFSRKKILLHTIIIY